jgi:2-desacetyl-2-hydroxyethyl bacteriochlorophyllide A dehydrogenase
MHAVIISQPEKLAHISVDRPGSPGTGMVRLRVHRVGICGTDYAGYLGKFPFFSYPRIPGHELGVEVLEIGSGVEGLRTGDRCAVEPYMNCETCYACSRGHGNCCEHLEVLGVHVDGGMREEIIVPARKLHKSTKLSYDELALVEPLTIGAHAVERGMLRSGDRVLVVGAGPIGLAVIQFAQSVGALVTVLDVSSSRLDFCSKNMNVTEVIRFAEMKQAIDDLSRATDGRYYSVVFDATGSLASMENAFNYVAHSGRLVFAGIVTSNISFPDPLFHRRELTLLASRNSQPSDFAKVISFLEKNEQVARTWITHQTQLAQLPLDMPFLLRPETRVIKAMVEVTA